MKNYTIERKPTTRHPGWIVIKEMGEGFGYWKKGTSFSDCDENEYRTLAALVQAKTNLKEN